MKYHIEKTLAPKLPWIVWWSENRSYTRLVFETFYDAHEYVWYKLKGRYMHRKWDSIRDARIYRLCYCKKGIDH